MLRKFAIVTLVSLSTVACTPQSPVEPPSSGGTGGKAGGSGGKPGGSGGSGGSGNSGGSGGGSSNSGGSGGGSGGQMGDGGGGSDTPSTDDPCKASPDGFFCKPTGKLPTSLKATGIYTAAPDLTKFASNVKEFKPNPELWSDGMGKQRLIFMPKGEKIDNTERTKWEFPVGTVFIKTFFDDGGMGGKARPIETRFIRKIAGNNTMDDYDFHVYQWKADGTDADLVITTETDEMKSIQVPITINRMVDGKPLIINEGKPFNHDLPSRQMCKDCHESSYQEGSQAFIGFDEVRLNSKLTPNAAKTQLQEFADAGFFKNPLPNDPATITDADARMERIKRAFFGNCVHCHMGGKVFDLRPNVLVENTVGKPTEAQSVHPPEGWLRVIPQDPERSVLYRQMVRINLPMPMGNDERLRPMPPIGVADYAPMKAAVDQAVLDDVRAWIMSLPKN
jgi:hypothetical protein